MAFQYGVALRTNQVAQLQATIGAAGTLKIFSGAEPANCAAADPAGLLATITLPAAFLTSASGVTTLAGTWSVAAAAAGTALSFRMYDGALVCHLQGNCTTDMTLNNPVLVIGQVVSVTTFSVTAGNA
jgi:hypothetical protein